MQQQQLSWFGWPTLNNMTLIITCFRKKILKDTFWLLIKLFFQLIHTKRNL